MKVCVPAAVGVPDIRPLEVKVRPGGREEPVAGAQLNVKGGNPPLAVRWSPKTQPNRPRHRLLYGCPTLPFGKAPEPGEIVSGSMGPIVMEIGDGFRAMGGLPESAKLSTRFAALT
jgi:hypothetical protein